MLAKKDRAFITSNQENFLDVKFLNQTLLEDNLLYIDGLSRCGKFLLGKIVSNMEQVEFFQYEPLLGHLPILYHLDKMKKDDVISYTKTMLNMFMYHRAIGRGMNLRTSDSSSVMHAADFEKYLKRTEEPYGMEAVNNLKKYKKYHSFVLNECLNFIDIFYATSPLVKVINIRRHPLDTIHSWYLRGWGKRMGIDPLAFTPTIDLGDESGCSWFFKGQEKEYQKMGEMDRVVASMVILLEFDMKALEKNKDRIGKDLLIISYEDFFKDPYVNVNKIANFLNVKPTKEIDAILEREGCGNKPKLLADRKRKWEEIKSMTSPDLIEKIKKPVMAFEAMWNLETAL